MAENEPRQRRETKAVEAFTIEEKEKAEFVIGKGAGTKLGEIENVKVKMDKLNAAGDELKHMHRACFGRPGAKTMIKRNLREFSGLTVTGVELERREASVAKFESKVLKALLTLCDLSTTGTKVCTVQPQACRQSALGHGTHTDLPACVSASATPHCRHAGGSSHTPMEPFRHKMSRRSWLSSRNRWNRVKSHFWPRRAASARRQRRLQRRRARQRPARRRRRSKGRCALATTPNDQRALP